MAPLDPASKRQVMSQLRSFCESSVVLVIYHTDVRRGLARENDGELEECITSNDFSNHNLHILNHQLVTQPVC